MSRALTYKPKKKRAMSRAFNFLSYFPNALGNFLLLRPINQTEIMKPYINDESIDLQDKTVREELRDKLECDQCCSLIPIPGLKELILNEQKTDARHDDVAATTALLIGFAGLVSGATGICLFMAGAPLWGTVALIPIVSVVGRIAKFSLEKKSTDKIIKKIADKRAKKHQKRLAYIKEASPLLN